VSGIPGIDRLEGGTFLSSEVTSAPAADHVGTHSIALFPYHRQTSVLIVILAIAGFTRLFQVGRSSLWYDEVVTMRLARTESAGALLELLNRIDATRAPLHPLLLQRWISLFGPSDRSGRVFSVICGVITVFLVYWISLRAFDVPTGLWGSWLCAVSPFLVYYSREVRMYIWLTMVTCLAWGLLFSHKQSPGRLRLAVYALAVIALLYSHPLGLLMAGTLGLASLLFHRSFQISWSEWLAIHIAIVVAVAPWVGRYFDHAPESITGLLPLRYLLGMPIGYIGGNRWTLVVCSFLILYGLIGPVRQKLPSVPMILDHPAESLSLLLWLVVPPLSLYAYSLIAYPIFGLARYTLFVGPAFLILVARGLAKLPWMLGLTAAGAGAILSGAMLLSDVYRPDLKADWRDLAAYLDQRDPFAVVAVIAADQSNQTELETARYYLEPGQVVIPWSSDRVNGLIRREQSVWVSISLQDGRPLVAVPASLTTGDTIQEVVDFARLRLMKVKDKQALPAGK
jgi:mannosyltransferase